MADFQRAHCQWVEVALTCETAVRDDCWLDAIAVGSLAFVEKVRRELGDKAIHRKVAEVGGAYTLREEFEAYGGNFGSESDALMPENSMFWKENAENTET